MLEKHKEYAASINVLPLLMAILWAPGRNANFLMSKCVDHQFEFTPCFDVIVILAPKNHDIKAHK